VEKEEGHALQNPGFKNFRNLRAFRFTDDRPADYRQSPGFLILDILIFSLYININVNT
jgi:hypothetical protein